jgi:uncharacterized protein (TIGR03067 family)
MISKSTGCLIQMKKTMKNILSFCFVVVLSLLAATANSAEKGGPLDGVWIPVKAELGGQVMSDAVLKTIILKINKTQYEVTVEGTPQSDEGTIEFDPSAKPKGMKIAGQKGPNAGKIIPAIYELKADTLRVCYDLSGASRPTDFKSSGGTKLYLVTYNRKK